MRRPGAARRPLEAPPRRLSSVFASRHCCGVSLVEGGGTCSIARANEQPDGGQNNHAARCTHCVHGFEHEHQRPEVFAQHLDTSEARCQLSRHLYNRKGSYRHGVELGFSVLAGSNGRDMPQGDGR